MKKRQIEVDETYQELLATLRPEGIKDYPSVLGKLSAAAVLFLRLDVLARDGKLPKVWRNT
jgi:hypothetical protein